LIVIMARSGILVHTSIMTREHAKPRKALLAGVGVLALALAAVAELPPPPEEGHRPLRDNPAGPAPDPTPPEAFTGYPDAPSYAVVPREKSLSHYPCATCHAQMPVNETRRKLAAPHPAALDHGDGRFWCLDCHHGEDRNVLKTSAGTTVDFNRADKVCASCHAGPHRDWTFGVHGKRVGQWQGERTYYGCAHCHNPHDPALRPRAPEGPPGIRAGLEPMPDRESEHD
jgi:hypothetical protein